MRTAFAFIARLPHRVIPAYKGASRREHLKCKLIECYLASFMDLSSVAACMGVSSGTRASWAVLECQVLQNTASLASIAGMLNMEKVRRAFMVALNHQNIQ